MKIEYGRITAKADEWSEFCGPGIVCNPHMIRLHNDISLRIISFTSQLITYPVPVIIIPGLVSVMLSFKHLIRELSQHYIVHYVETREKSSSILPEGTQFDVSSIGSDISGFIKLMGFSERYYILIGASLSATAIIDQYSALSVRPFCLALLEPNTIFDYPQWGLTLIRFSLWINSKKAKLIGINRKISLGDRILKKLAKWYLKWFRTNLKQDDEMYRISSRAIDSADPYKLKRTVLAISSFRLGDQMKFIDCPTLVVYASKDRLHKRPDILRIVKEIKNCEGVDLEAHKRTNGKDFVDQLRRYIRNLQHPHALTS